MLHSPQKAREILATRQTGISTFAHLCPRHESHSAKMQQLRETLPSFLASTHVSFIHSCIQQAFVLASTHFEAIENNKRLVRKIRKYLPQTTEDIVVNAAQTMKRICTVDGQDLPSVHVQWRPDAATLRCKCGQTVSLAYEPKNKNPKTPHHTVRLGPLVQHFRSCPETPKASQRGNIASFFTATTRASALSDTR